MERILTLIRHERRDKRAYGKEVLMKTTLQNVAHLIGGVKGTRHSVPTGSKDVNPVLRVLNIC